MQYNRRSNKCWSFGFLLSIAFLMVVAGCSGGGDGDTPRLPNAQPASVTLEPGAATEVLLKDGYPPYRVISQEPAAVAVMLSNRSAARIQAASDAREGVYRVSVIDSRGGVGIFTVNIVTAPLRILSPSPLFLTPASIAEVEIRGGVAPYRVVSDQSDLLYASVEGNRLQLQARGAVGSANVNVADNSGASTLLAVQVRTSLPLTVQPAVVTIPVGMADFELQILGGQPPYSAIVSNPGALGVRVDHLMSKVYLLGLAASEDLAVTVTDHVGQMAQAIVTVKPMTREFGISPVKVEISEASDQQVRFAYVGLRPALPVMVLTSNHRLLQLKPGTLSSDGFVVEMQGTGACVESDEAVTITAVDSTGAAATAMILVKNVANRYDDEGNLISRCPPNSL